MSIRDEESTQEIDVDALRDSLAAARGKRSGALEDLPPASVTAHTFAPDPSPIEPIEVLDADAGDEELADINDVSEVVDDDEDDSGTERGLLHATHVGVPASARIHDPPATRNDLGRRPDDPAPSLIGTLPGHDVAQALRAMMGEVPDTYAREYNEPPPSSHRHGENATPFVEPRGYRPLSYENESVRDDAPSRGDAGHRGGIDESLEEGDTQTRLPGDPPSIAAKIARERAMELEAQRARDALPADPRDSDALPAFALEDEDDPLGDSHAHPQLPPNATSGRGSSPPKPWGLDTLASGAPSAAAMSNQPAPATTRAFDGDLTAITRTAAAGPMPALALRDDSSSLESTSITSTRATSPGIPTPAFAMEVAQIAQHMHTSEPRLAAAIAETTASFKGPLPSMARPSVRGDEGAELEGSAPVVHRPREDSFIEDSEPSLRAIRSDWDPNEPSSRFPVAKPHVDLRPQSSPSFAAPGQSEPETYDALAAAAAARDPAPKTQLAPGALPPAVTFPDPDELPGDRTAIHRAHHGEGIGGRLSDPIDDALDALENNGELPRFTLASIPEMDAHGPAPEPAPPVEMLPSLDTDEGEVVEEPTATGVPTIGVMSPEPAPLTSVPITPSVPISEGEPSQRDNVRATSSPSMPSIDIRISSPEISTRAPTEEGALPALGTTDASPAVVDVHEETTSAGRAPPEVFARAATRIDDAPQTQAMPGAPAVAAAPVHDSDPIDAIDDAEIVEIVGDELIEDEQTNAGVPLTTASPGAAAAPRSPSFRPAPALTGSAPPPALPASLEQTDAEEQELIAEQRWGPLIAVYRQRLAITDGPNKKAAILIKIARVYESGMDDKNEAFNALVDAFETAPGNEDVVTEIDRVGGEAGRIGELADRVKKKLLPGAPEDKRIHYLGHLVYWYERVLNKGREVSSFVSEIERHDKVHPVVLKRSAQIAAMNGDTKLQREHLLRALERTVRREEKVALHLALAGAFAGTPDAMKHYEAALTLDPNSLPALQGMKRLGKEKEQYAQVQWALERQAAVAPTEAEKIDALLELAELQESKFLKREAAAELYEQVLQIEPAHPAALKALERCYHAIRDWPRLSRILSVRAEYTFEKSAKIELLERAAEVHESKLGDPAGAVEVYRNLLVVEPKHRRALADLARLYEKLCDWGNVATYKSRLAELAPTKRASSQELVKLGDFLNHPDRDSIAAKLQYEKAVQVDPTNAAGWEALQRFAVAEGDERRVIECLEQRKKHTDVPRQRAVVLVELANVHQRAGDDEAAKKCFEAAIRADSSNEIAAIAMLDVYTAEERWPEAAPLCELLVNAAIRDRDGEALFVRLRLATRIAAALGDADRAVTSAVAALDARPKDAGAQADLIAVCSQSPASVPRVREPLLRVAETSEELGADLLVRLAALLRELTELDVAAAVLERARLLDPDSNDITKELADVYLAQADFPRACKLKVDMARNATEPDLRFDLLVDAAEIWARRADELEKAASLFEEARGIKPNDPWLLQTLIWLYGELGEWGLLIGVLDDLAQTQENPDEKIKSIVSMAEVVRDKLNDRVRAADLLDQAIDIDKKRLDLFEEVVRLLTEDKNWERLERAYRKMIARVKDDDEPQLQFLLFHQLGLIYRDRLGDASRAYDALDAASRLEPENAEVRKIVTELLVVTDNLDNAVQRIRDEIDRDPHDAQLYAELYDLFLRQHYFDKAWCAVNVLARLRDLSPEQLRFHDDYSPMPLDRIPGQIVEQAWRSHIFHPDLDPALTSLFAVMTPAVARMRFGQLRPEQRVGRPFTPTHSRMHDAIRLTFNNASEILAVPAPELLLGDLKSATPFAPALAPFGAILVSGPAVEAQADSLIYMCGKRLAEQRPELTARAFLTVPDLVSLVATAIRVSRQEVAKDPAAAALDASFSAILTPQERESIRRIVTTATQDGNSFDVKRWSQCADLSSMRAGLLLAGDVEPARNSIGAEIVAPADLTPREKIGELLKFATSDQYSDLRGAIGVAVQS